MEKDANCLSSKKYHKPEIASSFFVVLFQFYVVFFFENKSIRRCFMFYGLFVVIHHFFKKINVIKSKLYSDKNDAIRLRFPICICLYLFAFKRFSCSTGYAYLKALTCLVEITLTSHSIQFILRNSQIRGFIYFQSNFCQNLF